MMNAFLVLERSRLPISAVLISQLLTWGCLYPAWAQSLPDSSVRD
jgi:hypothetical protein